MHGLVPRRIGFAMGDARARTHALRIAAANNRSGTHAVAMFQGPLQNVGDNFHVAMSMRGKAVASLNKVFIDYAKRTEARVLWVIKPAEGKTVISIEPAEIEMAALFSFANCDHENPSITRRSSSS